MSLVWIAVLALSVNPTEGSTSAAASAATPSAASEAPQAAPRQGRELEQATRTALAKSAKVSDKEADATARELLKIYRELQQDTRMARSVRDELSTRVRGRLSALGTQISRRIAREKRQNPAGPKSVAVAKDEKVLAQQLAGGGQAFGGGGNNGGQQPQAADNGEDLIQLIQTVVQPKSWDVNGGPGSIYYWRNQHAIVVRNTAEVHDDLTDMLDQLNRATH